MEIAVVGTGYVGLVTGTCFAETGNKVTCVDIDKSKVEKLSAGQITIYEPGLEKIFLRNIKEERLRFTTQLEEVVEEAEIIFLALPTPPGADGSADLKYVLGVADHLGKILKDYKVIVNKSTVPVGTADKVNAAIAKNYSGEFDVVSNPEFLREGVAVDDFMKPDRVVVGTRSDRAKKLMSDLYAPFVRQGNPVIFMDERSSELTKYAANSFLATKISFMNEILVARNEFAAYFVNSELRSSIKITGLPCLTNGAYSSLINFLALSDFVPTTTLSGFMKSSTATPSLKNSGLLTTSYSPL